MASAYKSLVNSITITRSDSGTGSAPVVYTCPADMYAFAYMTVTAISGSGSMNMYAAAKTNMKVVGNTANLNLLAPGVVHLDSAEDLVASFAGGSGWSITVKIQIFEFAKGIKR